MSRPEADLSSMFYESTGGRSTFGSLHRSPLKLWFYSFYYLLSQASIERRRAMHAFAMSELMKSSRAAPDAAQSTSVLERWNALQTASQVRSATPTRAGVAPATMPSPVVLSGSATQVSLASATSAMLYAVGRGERLAPGSHGDPATPRQQAGAARELTPLPLATAAGALTPAACASPAGPPSHVGVAARDRGVCLRTPAPSPVDGEEPPAVRDRGPPIMSQAELHDPPRRAAIVRRDAKPPEATPDFQATLQAIKAAATPAQAAGAKVAGPQGEQAAHALSAAQALVAYTEHIGYPIPTAVNDPASTLPASAKRPAAEAAVARVLAVCGRTPKPATDMRLMLQDWVAFRKAAGEQVPKVFPIVQSDAEEFHDSLVRRGLKTAVARIPAAAADLCKLGFEASLPEEFGRKYVAAVEQKEKTRDVPPPKLLWCIEQAAKGLPLPGTGKPAPPVLLRYIRHVHRMARYGLRGVDAYLAYVPPQSAPPSVLGFDGIVIGFDKHGRKAVRQWAPNELFFEDGPMPWADEEASELAAGAPPLVAEGSEYLFPAFDAPRGASSDPSKATGWAGGAPAPSAGKTPQAEVTKAINYTLVSASGLKLDDLNP